MLNFSRTQTKPVGCFQTHILPLLSPALAFSGYPGGPKSKPLSILPFQLHLSSLLTPAPFLYSSHTENLQPRECATFLSPCSACICPLHLCQFLITLPPVHLVKCYLSFNPYRILPTITDNTGLRWLVDAILQKYLLSEIIK